MLPWRKSEELSSFVDKNLKLGHNLWTNITKYNNAKRCIPNLSMMPLMTFTLTSKTNVILSPWLTCLPSLTKKHTAGLVFIVFTSLFLYLYITILLLCRGHSWQVRLAKQETLTPPGHLVSPLVCRGPRMSTVVLHCWCHSDGASILLYFTFLSHLFPLPCGAGSTVPREGFDSSVIMPFSWCVVAVTLPIKSVHIQCHASFHTLSLYRGHSWQVRLAKQETLTPPGHLVSPLVCRGPRMSTVVLYCWCHSDGASVLLYFTLSFVNLNFDLWPLNQYGLFTHHG